MKEVARFYNQDLSTTRGLISSLVSCDHSGSIGFNMGNVISGVSEIYDVIEGDPNLKDTVQLTVTAFNEKVDVIKYPDEPNRSNHKLLNLKAIDGTNMYESIVQEGKMLLHSIKEQQKVGCVFIGAFLMKITDGEPTDARTQEYDNTIEYLRKKGVKLIAVALPGADMNFLNNEFDIVIPISDVRNLPTILKSICQTILPAVSQSRPGESLKFKFKTNDGIQVLDVDVDEVTIDQDCPIIDVIG